MIPWSELRATVVPPDREAEAASSRDALRLALALRDGATVDDPRHPHHVYRVGPGEAMDPGFIGPLGEYVALLGGAVHVNEIEVQFDG